MFNFLSNCQIFSPKCIILYLHPPYIRVLVEPYGICSGILLWFYFAFPWYLMMLSIFSYAYWPYIYFLLWRVEIFLYPPRFILACLSWYWVGGVPMLNSFFGFSSCPTRNTFMKYFAHCLLVKLTTILLQRVRFGFGQVCWDIPQPTKEEVSKNIFLSLCPHSTSN